MNYISGGVDVGWVSVFCVTQQQIMLGYGKKRLTQPTLFFLLFFILFSTTIHATTNETYPFSSQTDASRFQTLTKEIRCVVCQNQSIADSNAPLANDLREKMYKMVLANETNDAIKTYLVKRYGEFILLKPRFNAYTFILWLFPVLGLALTLFVFSSLSNLLEKK